MMFAEKKEIKKQEAVFPIKKGKHRVKIFEVLISRLYIFSVEFINTLPTNINQDVSSENYISQELSNFLNNKVADTGYLFMFQATGPDIFVRQFGDGIHGQTLLFIEAKRLYSGAGKDYVDSGISRFKKGTHGEGHDVAAMLGYVQGHDFDHWYNKVNSWIDDLISEPNQNQRWEKQDKLATVKVAAIAEYTSKHSRLTKKTIMKEQLDLFLESSQQFLNEIAVALPQIIGALLILLIGWILARIVKRLSIKGLKLVRFNYLTEKSGIEKFLEKGGVKVSSIDVIGTLIYWIIMLAVILATLNSLKLTAASTLFNQIMLYIPNIIVANHQNQQVGGVKLQKAFQTASYLRRIRPGKPHFFNPYIPIRRIPFKHSLKLGRIAHSGGI